MTGTLAPDSVLPLLRGRFGRPYIYRPVCDSTQRLLSGRLPEGATAVCEEQVAGRGRSGRRWEAPRGKAILCSLLLRPPPARRAAELALVGGLATAEAIERAVRSGAQIKWPNDVLLAGAKVAGVIAEARGQTVVLGVGINVGQAQSELPAQPRSPAGSLALFDGIERDRAPILVDLLETLEHRYAIWGDQGFAGLHEALSARDVLRGRRISVAGAAGLAAGIDEAGRLEVDTAAGRVAVVSGEVSIVPDC
jgi:BirA family biotin operon repressor/biotin-[acetyl-CoA-carboxylase] ligase